MSGSVSAPRLNHAPLSLFGQDDNKWQPEILVDDSHALHVE